MKCPLVHALLVFFLYMSLHQPRCVRVVHIHKMLHIYSYNFHYMYMPIYLINVYIHIFFLVTYQNKYSFWLQYN